MRWFDGLIDDLAAELGSAPRRLLRAMIEVASPLDEDTRALIADKARTLAHLEAQEGAPLTDVALRQRIKQINDAAKKIGSLSALGGPPLRMRSRKTHLAIEFTAEGLVARDQDRALEDAIESTREDAAHADTELEEPHHAKKPTYRVFCSHAWTKDEIDQTFLGFVRKLKDSLKRLPSKWGDRFSVELWFDEQDMHGTAFQDQMDTACRDSELAIFFLSEEWYASEPCQCEAAFFTSNEDHDYLLIQLSGDWEGDREQGDPSLTDRPVYPAWPPNSKFPNLHYLWHRGDPPDRTDFVRHIRDKICKALERHALPPPMKPTRGDRMRSAVTEARHRFDPVVTAGKTEDPRTTAREGEGDAAKLLPLLHAWVSGDEAPNRVYAVLGSFGSGKTTAVQMFAADLLKTLEDDPKAPFPIYLDLRRLIESATGTGESPIPLAKLILQCLNPAAAVNMDPEQLIEALRTERCVVIFDGLDEVGTRIGPEQAASLYRQLLEVVPSEAWNEDRKAGRAAWDRCPTRLLITCRTHFFRDHFEEQSTLAARDRHGHRPGRDGNPVETVYMAPFSPGQIRSSFEKTLGKTKGARVFRELGQVHDLMGLARKPLMSRFIAARYTNLEEDVRSGRPVNAARVYEWLFRRAIERDGDKRPLMTQVDREDLLEELARHLWQARTPILAADELDRWFDRFTADHPGLSATMRSSIEARQLLHTELRNASLLIREHADGYRFNHTSFQEYFLARSLLSVLLGERPDGKSAEFDAAPAPSRETADFMLDLVEASEQWRPFGAALDRALRPGRPLWQRALSFRLRNAMSERGRGPFALPEGADLSDLDLQFARLTGRPSAPVRLCRVSFAGTRLLDTYLEHVTFEGCRFDGAWFGHARLDRCRFVGCAGAPAHIASARCRDIEADAESEASVLGELILRVSSDGPRPSGATGRGVVRLNFGHHFEVTSTVYAPDGSTILTASLDGTARIWDAQTGTEITRFEGHDGRVTSAVYAPDGATILTAGDDGTARIWDAQTSTEVTRFKGHGGRAMSAVYAPDGTAVLTADDDGTAHIWDVRTGAEIARFEGHGCGFVSAVYAPDGTAILTAGLDGTARIWDVRTGTETARFEGHGAWVSSAIYAPDGATVLTAGHDGIARIWDVRTGFEVARFKGHRGRITNAFYAPDGTAVLTVGNDGRARIWDVHTHAEVTRFGYWIMSAVYTPDGAAILTASIDGSACIRDVRSGVEIFRFRGHGGGFNSAVYAPDGATFLTAGFDRRASIWDVHTGAEVARFEGHCSQVKSAVYAPDGATILTTAFDNTARIWDVCTGTEVTRFEGHGGGFVSAIYAPDGATILTVGDDERVCTWDIRTGAEIIRLGDSVISAVYAPDGTTILTAGLDRTARIWDAHTGTEITRFKGHVGGVMNAVYAPDGDTILTIGFDGTPHIWDMRIWDVCTGTETTRLKGRSGGITSVVYAPDGTTILTADLDGTARIWDAHTGTEITCFKGHVGGVMNAVYAPDGDTILTTGFDGAARIWDVETGRNLAILVGLPKSWAVLDADLNVTRASPDAWAYLHGLVWDEDGPPRVTAPDLASVQFVAPGGHSTSCRSMR